MSTFPSPVYRFGAINAKKMKQNVVAPTLIILTGRVIHLSIKGSLSVFMLERY